MMYCLVFLDGNLLCLVERIKMPLKYLILLTLFTVFMMKMLYLTMGIRTVTHHGELQQYYSAEAKHKSEVKACVDDHLTNYSFDDCRYLLEN